MFETDKGFRKDRKKYFSRGNTPKIKIFDDIKIPSENLSSKDDSVKAPTENQHYLDKNKIVPGFSNEEESLFDDMTNADEVIRNYNDYLIWLNKKFDKFFLCYNKDQFKAVMAEKGIRFQESREEQRGKTQITDAKARTIKKKKTKRFEGFEHTNKMHIDANNANKENKESTKFDDTEVEFDEDDLPAEPNEEGEQDKIRRKGQKTTDIFQRFLEEQENKTNEYIHERELRKKRVVHEKA
jgi:hypothetical protein